MINENFGTKIYSNFVPNYRNLATISQIFGAEIGVKHKVLLERAIIQGIVSKPEEVVESFNAKYSEQLDENQKELIGKYVTLFADNSIEFKVYLNEELHRLKEEVKKMSDAEDISGDKDMQQKVALVSEKMESFKGQPIDDKMIQQVLKIQALTRETVL